MVTGFTPYGTPTCPPPTIFRWFFKLLSKFNKFFEPLAKAVDYLYYLFRWVDRVG